MEELSMDSAMTEDFIDKLFSEDPVSEEEAQEQETAAGQEKENSVDKVLNSLSAEGTLSDEQKASLFEESATAGEGEETDQTTPPYGDLERSQLYSSISKALSEDGVFEGLDEDTLNGIKDPDSFVAAIDKVLESRLNERQLAIERALHAGVPKDELLQYKNAIDSISRISDDVLASAGDDADNLRKHLIMRDLVLKGFSEGQATNYAKSLFETGKDVEAAKEAKASILQSYQRSYSSMLQQREAAQKAEQENYIRYNNELKEYISTGDFFGGLKIDKTVRDKAAKILFDANSRASNGRRYTALEKYSVEHPKEFRANMAMLFALTDGFTNLSKVVETQANKAVKQRFRDLEDSILSSANKKGGSLNYVSGFDPESNFSKY